MTITSTTCTAAMILMKYKVEPKLSDSSDGPALTDFNQELLTFTEDATKYYRDPHSEDTATNSNPYWWGQYQLHNRSGEHQII